MWRVSLCALIAALDFETVFHEAKHGSAEMCLFIEYNEPNW